MNERITLVSLFNLENLNKISNIINTISEPLCKVPFGKNVDNRIETDTLPYHFTIFSWDIKKEKEIIDFLSNITYKSFNVLVDKIEIVEGNEGSYELRFNVLKNDELHDIQNYIFNKYSSKYYIPENFNFHITIHIDKDYDKILNMKEKILQDFVPFELTVDTIGLFEIYPAKLVKQFNSISDKDWFIKLGLTTINEFFEYMQNQFKYGWIDKDGNKHDGVNDARTYSLQSPSELLNSHLGICWDMTELYRSFFENMTDLKYETYYLFYDDNKGCPSHSILVFYNNDKVYWFEPMFTDDNCYYSSISLCSWNLFFNKSICY